MYIFVLKQCNVIHLITNDGFVEIKCQHASKINMSPMHFQTHTDNTGVVLKEKKNRCDVFREIMDTEYSNKNKLFCVGDTCTFVGMSVYGLWVVSTVRCCSKGPPNYPSLFLLP